ncbi:MarC family NAAT transporter [Pseudochelatococcus sp. G4_1912]|jgi:multiple antibiotic resistance protein|uniref:MarC family NAAT transporter n=1 Tax=Pseudochelatococcus sp. G4_1912 TaxID=3114288 RepID=UPI0039C6E2C8
MDLFLTGLKFFITVVASLLPIINPISTMPLFLSLTDRTPDAYRRQQARKCCLYAFSILATFLIAGHGIIAMLGISLAGIRVAGGLILLVSSARMLFSGDSEASSVSEDVEEMRRARIDYSFSPLAMPIMSGPGSIAAVLSFASEVPEDQVIGGYIIILLGVAAVIGLTYVVLRFATLLSRFLGPQGVSATTKIMGFLLACISVQIIASGVMDFIKEGMAAI